MLSSLYSVFDLPLEHLLGLDTSDEANISLNLLPLVLKQPYVELLTMFVLLMPFSCVDICYCTETQ